MLNIQTGHTDLRTFGYGGDDSATLDKSEGGGQLSPEDAELLRSLPIGGDDALERLIAKNVKKKEEITEADLDKLLKESPLGKLFGSVSDFWEFLFKMVASLNSSNSSSSSAPPVQNVGRSSGGGGGGGYSNAAPASYNRSSSPSGSVSNTSFKGSFDPRNSGLSNKAPAPGQPMSEKERHDTAAKVITNLQKDLGITAAQASGIVGNFMQESGMNPHVNEGIGDKPITYGGVEGGDHGYGWAQWSFGRKQDYLKYVDEQNKNGNPMEVGSPASNYGFLVHELKTSESRTLDAFNSNKGMSPTEAAGVFRRVFERANEQLANDDNRITWANTLYAAYNNSNNRVA